MEGVGLLIEYMVSKSSCQCMLCHASPLLYKNRLSKIVTRCVLILIKKWIYLVLRLASHVGDIKNMTYDIFAYLTYF